MDVSELLTNTNKISLAFFLITSLLIGYELFLFAKDKGKKKKPTIPGFKTGVAAPSAAHAPAVQKIQNAKNTHRTIAAKVPVAAYKPMRVKKGVNKNLVGLIAAGAVLLATGFIVYFSLAASSDQNVPALNTQASAEITPLPTLAPVVNTVEETSDADANASDEADIIALTDEADETNLAQEETDLDTSEFDATDSATVTPTPITQLPNSSTYQYFIMLSVAATSIIMASLFL